VAIRRALAEQLLIALAAVALTVVPLIVGGVHGVAQWVGACSTVVGALALVLWRRFAGAVVVIGPGLILVSLFTGPDPSDFVLLLLMAYAALAAEHHSGRRAWAAGFICAAYIGVIYAVTGEDDPGLFILTAPGFLAGTVLRLRRETAEALEARGRELELERELFAEVSVRNERARIASELHDIVGHALSVMVVQAAAAQRLAANSPDAVTESLEVIAESAREGRADLQRLIDLLAGTEVVSPDLALIDELVSRAARSGLRVTCRVEGSRDGLRAEAAHVAFRVLQESLTNALRHAPGAEVRVLIRAEHHGRTVTVRVENDAAPALVPAVSGGGRGLIGLRERVMELGGTFSAGPTFAGGWAVEALLAR
jgi:signal transduction histidine kinase